MWTAYGRKFENGWTRETALFSFRCPSANADVRHAVAHALATTSQDVTAIRIGEHAPQTDRELNWYRVVRKLWTMGWSINRMAEQLPIAIEVNGPLTEHSSRLLSGEFNINADAEALAAWNS